MEKQDLLKFLWFPFTLLLILLACSRETSFEGGGTPPRIDTIHTGGGNGGGGGNGTPQTGTCSLCIGNDVQAENRWSLHAGTQLYCGKIDTLIVLGERTTFTFFGPSSCSADSGMVVTVYLDGFKLDHDITSRSAARVSFFYYDRVTPSYMLMSQVSQPFFLNIDEYNNTTKLIRGTFNGYAYDANGFGVPITAGKFESYAK